SFDPGTRTLTGTPGQAQVGEHDVQLAVSDGTATVPQDFKVTVANVNDPPVITTSPPLNVNQGVLYSYTIEAADLDGDTLTYSALARPDWLVFDAETRTLSGTPHQPEVGGHEVRL